MRPRPGDRRDELLELLLATRNRRKRGRGGGKRVFAIVVLTAAVVLAGVCGATVIAAAGAVHHALTDCALAGRRAKPLPQTSFLFARGGKFLGAVHAPEYRTPVAYGEISPWVRRATVAAEDRTFWTNDGLDLSSIARAALADVAAGKPVQGASTITQQLVRNLYLDDSKTLERKRVEACLSLKLTKSWSKRRILAAYLNRIPYGHRALGIEAAAQTYFGIDASRLGPAQAALLAGLPQAPSRYDPFAHPQAALARRNQVLRAMRASGDLSPADYRKVVQRPLGLRRGYTYSIRRDPNFFSYVQKQLVAVYGEQTVREGGLRVYTTLDSRRQALARRSIRGVLDRKGDPASAVVSINPWNGAIETLVSLAHRHRLQFDLAAQGRRQPGSAFKTFVLTDAIWHKHADPDRTIYVSSPFTYQPTAQSKPWKPHTYENEFFGPETLTKATLLSDNVVFAKLTLDLGPRSVARVAHRLGIRSKLPPVPSIGLGADAVTPLELASAYATLASGGVYHRPHAIRKVVLPDGKVDTSHRWGAGEGRRVLPTGVAWAVTQVLEQNVLHGTGLNARIPGRHVAGKTGTTTDWTDAWFCGYTPRLTTVVWVGYPNKTVSMRDVHGIEVQGATFPAEIWHGYMRPALHGKRPIPFEHASWPMVRWEGARGAGGSSRRTAGSG